MSASNLSIWAGNRPRDCYMAMPMVSSAECVVAPFCLADVALCDIQTCFATCRKSFCVAGAILSRRFQKTRGSFRGWRSTLDVSCRVFFANRIGRAASSGDKVQIRTCQNCRKSRTKYSFFCAHVSRLESLVFLWRRPVYGGSSALHTFESSLHTPHSTLYTPHCALCTLHSSLTRHFTLHTPHFTLYTPHSTLYTLHYTLHSTLYTILDSMWGCQGLQDIYIYINKHIYINKYIYIYK